MYYYNYFKYFLIIFIISTSCSKNSNSKSEIAKEIAKSENLIKNGYDNKGFILFKKLINKYPENEKIVQRFAISYNNKGKNREASNLLSDYLSKHQGSAYSWYLLGYSRYLERKSNAAVDALEQALRLQKVYPDAILLLGRIYENHKEYLIAKEVYHSISSKLYLKQKIVPILIRLANLELKKQKNLQNEKAAEAHLLSALNINPSSEEALLMLGTYYLEKNPKKAKDLYEKYIKFHNSSGLVLLSYAQSLFMTKQYKKALKIYQKSEKLRKNGILPVLGIIKTTEKLGKKDLLYSYLVKASALDTNNKEILWKLIPFYISKGRYITASNALEKVSDEYIKNVKYWRLKAEINEKSGYYKQAYDAWMTIMTLSNKVNSEFYKHAGKLARNAGLYSRAVDFLKQFCKKVSQTNISECTDLAISYWYSGKKQKGITLLNSLTKYSDPMPGIWLAQILYLSGKWQESEKILKNTENKLKNTEEMLFFYDVKSQLLYKNKKYDEYIKILKKEILLARNESEKQDLIVQLKSAQKKIATGGKNE